MGFSQKPFFHEKVRNSSGNRSNFSGSFEKSDFRGLGDYTLTQQDLVEGEKHADSVAVGHDHL